MKSEWAYAHTQSFVEEEETQGNEKVSVKQRAMNSPKWLEGNYLENLLKNFFHSSSNNHRFKICDSNAKKYFKQKSESKKHSNLFLFFLPSFWPRSVTKENASKQTDRQTDWKQEQRKR